MLGEGARTAEDAERNLEHYFAAVRAVGRKETGDTRSGVSVKLSAIHPRFEAAQFPRVRTELLARLRALCLAAAEGGIGLTIDAEESERLDPGLDLFAALAGDAALASWAGLGLVVQAYQVRATQTIERVLHVARQRRERGGEAVAVRLVKGAYWDAEIRRAQELGLDAYPVHTGKELTDLAYLACARRLLDNRDLVFPQFATHNPVSAACVLALAGDSRNTAPSFEFQRLHGMGESLQRALATLHPQVPVRIYAPVGRQRELLAYLVRRLLENGANTSFVRQAAGARDAKKLVAAGMACLDAGPVRSRLPQPREIFMPERLNARGYDLADAGTLARVAQEVARERRMWIAAPLIDGAPQPGAARRVFSPARPDAAIGESSMAMRPRRVARWARRSPRASAGRAPRYLRARPASTGSPTGSNATSTSSWPCASGKRARPCPMLSPTCAKPWISAATTQTRPASASVNRWRFRVRRARATP